jgi:ABC-type phosphate transport system substrate-binding protein
MKFTYRFLLTWLAVSAAAAFGADYKLITHPTTSASALSKEDVKNILLGNKTKWDGAGAIKLAVLAEGATHEAVIQEFTARTADQFDKYWKKQVFTGKGTAPDAFKTDAELVAHVAKTPGAFGYVSGSAKIDGVKVLAAQ